MGAVQCNGLIGSCRNGRVLHEAKVMLPAYERGQVESISTWKAKRLSIVLRLVGAALFPATWLLKKLIPTAAMRAALDARPASPSGSRTPTTSSATQA